jgi:hypothetical protein
MNPALICLHEDALRITHPIFNVAPIGTKAVYVWDDEYLRRANYSLKRLIFMYETLCDLPVDVIRGDTRSIVVAMTPAMLYVPATNNPSILSIFASIAPAIPLNVVDDEIFAVMEKTSEARRFFQYWSKVEKSAFLLNGGALA